MQTDPRLDRGRILQALRERIPSDQVPAGRPAGVILLLYGNGHNDSLIYTVRTFKVEHHKGEVSFPGGMRDPEDPSLAHTAVREAQEEIGVDPADIEVVAQLDPILTRRTNFTITPYVGVMRHPYTFTPSEHEVDEVLEVPLAHLLDPRNVRPDPDFGYVYHVGKHVIWGATSRITTEFLNTIAPDRW